LNDFIYTETGRVVKVYFPKLRMILAKKQNSSSAKPDRYRLPSSQQKKPAGKPASKSPGGL